MNFWHPWQAWIKMTFILACLIVAVLIISLVIRWRNKRRIKRYAQMSDERAAEEGNTVQSEKDEIPFGIRAIERSDEAEGSPPADVQRPASVHTVEPEKDEVPFGIRAIERSDEAEGSPPADVQRPAPVHTRSSTSKTFSNDQWLYYCNGGSIQ